MSSRLALSPHKLIIKNPEHQWEGLNSIKLLVDTEERRRVKNRLAQRKHRKPAYFLCLSYCFAILPQDQNPY